MTPYSPTTLHALLEVALRPKPGHRKQQKAGLVPRRPVTSTAMRTIAGWLHDTSDTLPARAETGHSYIYVVSVTLAGPVKFGRTSNARERIKSLETARGVRFGFIWISEVCSNAESIERALHAQSGGCRQIGEWFAMSFSDAVQLADDAPYVALDGNEYEARLAVLADNSLRGGPSG